MRTFVRQLRPAALMLLAMILLIAIYTGVMTGVAQIVFPYQANGSVITVRLADGTEKTYGSELLEQKFTDAKYLIGRPMDVTSLSPVSDEMKALIVQRMDWWRNFDPDATANGIPSDLINGSGSGVDPYISPEAAEFQVNRVAQARGISPDAVRAVIQKYTRGRFLGFIGEPGVNVLMVNLALDGEI